MRKVIIFILLIILTTPVFSQVFYSEEKNPFMNSYSYSLLKIYNGFNITEDGASYEFTGNLVNFIIMNENTGIGIDISPVRYFYSYSPTSNIWSFVNIYLYWDLYRIKHPYYFGEVFLGAPEVGPFVSINWVNVDDISSFNINKMIFSAGLRFTQGIRWNEAEKKRIMDNHTYLSIETGYRNIYRKHSFFLTFHFSLWEYFMVRIIAA